MIKKLLAAVLIWGWGFGNTAFAQKENNIWYFGDSVGVDFNSGSPVALTNGVIGTLEGSATISDSSGNLLFYTDGITVYNRFHQQMPNGFGLFGGNSTTQSALIIPQPDSIFIYYVFTLDELSGPDGLNYSIVDMRLDSGRGDVITKNSLLLSGPNISEKLAATYHSNGHDIWVAVHYYSTFKCYLVTSSGINSPVSSPAFSSFNGFDHNVAGQIKFSPDGSKLAYAVFSGSWSFTYSAGFYLFDNTSGLFSNNYVLNIMSNFCYGVEFSPDGSKLYISSIDYMPGTIVQYDLNAGPGGAINNSKTVVHYSSGMTGALQLAPDGKIYFARYLFHYLGVINNPNITGASCNPSDTGIYLISGQCMDGLPGFISQNNFTSGISTLHPPTSNLQISPNPATDKITISFPATTTENITVKIYSITGEVVFENENKTTGNNFNKTIEVKDFSNGIYFLSVQTGREVVTKKIVVNH